MHNAVKLMTVATSFLAFQIADFGLSNYFKPHSLLHTFCGSPLYASPEIINGTPYKGPEVITHSVLSGIALLQKWFLFRWIVGA